MNWISVEDKLPEGFSEVLVCVREPNGNTTVTTHTPAGKWWFESPAWRKVTHWAPMPEPPK